MENRLKSIVKHYIRRYQNSAVAESKCFQNIPLKQAIEKAALAQDKDGKRFDHQRRIPKNVLCQSKERLLSRMADLQVVDSFETLHKLVKTTIDPIQGVGELTVYDTAFRIGVNLTLKPKVVYLHAGTRQGARYLQKAYPLDVLREFLDVHDMPKPLQQLKPSEIEDVLCIYKKCFLCRRKGCPLPERRCGKETFCNSGSSKSEGICRQNM